MLKNHLFNVLIAIAFVIVALTVREATATSSIVSEVADTKCSSLPSHYSVHSKYVEEIGTSTTFTEEGPTVADGGLIHLLSAYRTCSQLGE